MKPILGLVALALLAGCVNEEESSGEPAASERARGVALSVPADVERLEVEVHASSNEMVSLRAELEREDGSDLANERFTVSGAEASRTLQADARDLGNAWVLVAADGGDATVQVIARGVTASNETVLLRAATFVIRT